MLGDTDPLTRATDETWTKTNTVRLDGRAPVGHRLVQRRDEQDTAPA